MTEQEMQIAVAESRGWTHIAQRIKCSSGKQLLSSGSYLGGIPPLASKDIDWEITSEPIPNYPQDLNAMHEIVSTARFSNQFFFLEYQRALTEVVQGRPYHQECDYYGSISSFECIEATAHQRCEAYLRVKGLWEEPPQTLHREIAERSQKR